MIKGENFEKFIKRDFIFIKNIFEGTEKYKHICFSGEYEEIEKYILHLIKENEKVFFDFYYSNLSKENKENFLNSIVYDKIIEEFDFCENEIYFDTKNASLDILKFILKISFNEILFSTFYFEKPKITIWTNYNKQIILFFEKEEDFIKQKEIGLKYGLNTIFEKE